MARRLLRARRRFAFMQGEDCDAGLLLLPAPCHSLPFDLLWALLSSFGHKPSLRIHLRHLRHLKLLTIPLSTSYVDINPPNI